MSEPLTPERLAQAIGEATDCGHSSCPRDTSRHLDDATAIIAALSGATTDGPPTHADLMEEVRSLRARLDELFPKAEP